MNLSPVLALSISQSVRRQWVCSPEQRSGVQFLTVSKDRCYTQSNTEIAYACGSSLGWARLIDE